MPDSALSRRDLTLLDLVDSILQRGTALSGDLTLSVADVDLVQVNLRALLASVETVQRLGSEPPPRPVECGSIDAPPPRPVGADRRGPVRGGAPRSRRRPRLPAPITEHGPARARVNTDPEDVERGLAQLVLTVVELLRQLMERQALYRMESNSLSEVQVERLGQTFMKLERRMEELTREFGLETEDLNLHLGPLGELL